MSFTSAPLNPKEALVDEQRRPTETFIALWTALGEDVDAAPARLDSPIALTAQGAAIGTTSIGTPDADGLYQIQWHLAITTAAGVSSSAQVTFSWTERTVTKTYVGTLVNGNTTTTHESAPPILIRADAATPITYSVSYASNPAGVMRFALDIVLTQVAA